MDGYKLSCIIFQPILFYLCHGNLGIQGIHLRGSIQCWTDMRFISRVCYGQQPETDLDEHFAGCFHERLENRWRTRRVMLRWVQTNFTDVIVRHLTREFCVKLNLRVNSRSSYSAPQVSKPTAVPSHDSQLDNGGIQPVPYVVILRCWFHWGHMCRKI